MVVTFGGRTDQLDGHRRNVLHRRSSVMSKLTGKAAVVTGASKGIGASIAENLGAAGGSVVVNYSSRQAGVDAVVAKITGKGGKAIAVQGNVSKQEGIKLLVIQAEAAYGKV